MNDWQLQAQRIQDKLQQLLKNYASSQKENQHLRQELERLKEEHQSCRAQVEDLQQKVSVLKMNAGELKEADKKELEKKISHYLKEIDRCIALLGE